MPDKLIGDKAIIGQTLDKVELAIRRALFALPDPGSWILKRLADEIMKIKQDMYDAH